MCSQESQPTNSNRARESLRSPTSARWGTNAGPGPTAAAKNGARPQFCFDPAAARALQRRSGHETIHGEDLLRLGEPRGAGLFGQGVKRALPGARALAQRWASRKIRPQAN